MVARLLSQDFNSAQTYFPGAGHFCSWLSGTCRWTLLSVSLCVLYENGFTEECVQTSGNMFTPIIIHALGVHKWSLYYDQHCAVCAYLPVTLVVCGGPDGHPFWPVHLQVTRWSVNWGINLSLSLSSSVCVCASWGEISVPARSGASAHLPVLLTTHIPLI